MKKNDIEALFQDGFITQEQYNNAKQCDAAIKNSSSNIPLNHPDLLKSIAELISVIILLLPNKSVPSKLIVDSLFKYIRYIDEILEDKDIDDKESATFTDDNIIVSINGAPVNINDIHVTDVHFTERNIFAFFMNKVGNISYNYVCDIIKHTNYKKSISNDDANNIINKFEEYRKLRREFASLSNANNFCAQIYADMYKLSICLLLFASGRINNEHILDQYAWGCMNRITNDSKAFILSDVEKLFVEILKNKLMSYVDRGDEQYYGNNPKQIGREDKNDPFCNMIKSLFINLIKLQIENPSLNIKIFNDNGLILSFLKLSDNKQQQNQPSQQQKLQQQDPQQQGLQQQ